ncbi:glycosyltransferase family 1 protein [Noviherbaspirillum galbum]|uniref:Glycosyltransferase family 1 protein n=1 Tax=Noviherbaspirillum galbum TaxID=2709383 RepID=A0A6B3SPF3_9BURK|nr:glycosyltransferase [Noviherbaspirillum galbum]NEX62714.1 glycosyltransferase family 1 protein [Noviherbaspirillum galbum]
MLRATPETRASRFKEINLRVAFVTNTPPPYRVPVLQRIARVPGVSFRAIFCARREPNRKWDLPALDFDHVFLRERFFTVSGRYIHNNPDVVGALRRFAPDVVVTDGFNPTHLYAFFTAWLSGRPHVAMTDGTDVSERGLGRLHRAARRLVYAHSAAFVPASAGGRRHYESYGVSPDRCFTSCLCVDNERFAPAPNQEKRFDFMFSGRIEAVKNPVFALSVAVEAAKRLKRRVSMLYAGAGGLEETVRNAAALHERFVDVHFHGFARQDELPALYRASRIFLFPTLWDPWGVVANEACAAGVPVLVSNEAGVAGELVRHGENGFICPMEASMWADRAALLLSRPDIYADFSSRGLHIVGEYNFDNAAAGLLDACRFALCEAEAGKVKMQV